MRRLMKGLAAAGLAVALAAPAFAGVTGTKHDMIAMTLTGQFALNRGVCSFCHVPHGAQGDRLWAGTPAAGYTPVANLCATCHLTGNGSITSSATESTNMFDEAAHGFDETVLTTAGTRYNQGQSLAGSGLPYTNDDAGVSGTNIDCTSCHDPHSNTVGQRPFLRMALTSLCQACHGSRETTGTMASNTNGATTPHSNHPVGASYTGRASAPITWTAAYQRTADLTNASNATEGNWTLGGHRTDGGTAGGVTCVTCHIVHGEDPTNGGALPQNDLLVNVKASAAGDLCTDCHGAAPGAAGTTNHPVATTSDATYAGSVTGNTLAVDSDAQPFLQDDVVSPSGVYADAGTLVCLSCHDIHFGEDASPVLADTAATSPDFNPFCQGCHIDPVITSRAHHPYTGSTSYDTATYEAYIVGGTSAAFYQQALGCETCHRAHNGVDQGITGSSADFLLRALNWDGPTNADTPASSMCVACHSANPARFKYNLGQAGDLGSHWVSHAAAIVTNDDNATPVLDAGEDTTRVPGLQTNGPGGGAPIRTTNWPATGLDYAGDGNQSSFSKVGGQTFDFATGPADTGGVICESCHSVTNPRDADWLLLGEFDTTARNTNDNTTASTATTQTAQGGDGLCLGCHGIPGGTHPTTGSTVTKTGAALNTDTSPYAAASPAGEAFYPAADEMTCTSCHDVHSGNTGAAIYILKNGQNNEQMGTATTLTDAVRAYTGSTVADPSLNFTDLCAACHDQYR
ncbi:cytochrome c3 family protein [Deferrisoma sp.]